ncbi:MAG: NUDIX domain-containing protein, partial [Candidatus Micrarchaeota archaeon]|nr:NUDIX domain-containing protein [Candidatus Micrarchaeota archaeon]
MTDYAAVFGNDMLEIYDLEGRFLTITERKSFYKNIKKEFKEKGVITEKVKSIRLLLMNSNGRIYIQKRSVFKERNGGLYDKTIGGHVKAGHTWELTVVKECHEELGFPAVVLTDDEFRNAITTTDIRIIGLFRSVEHIETFISISRTKTRNDFFKQPFITQFYIGYYDGPINFCDGESTGIEVFTLDELEKRIEEEPDKFTEDLKFMLKRYRDYLVPIERGPKKVLGYEENSGETIKKI